MSSKQTALGKTSGKRVVPKAQDRGLIQHVQPCLFSNEHRPNVNGGAWHTPVTSWFVKSGEKVTDPLSLGLLSHFSGY